MKIGDAVTVLNFFDKRVMARGYIVEILDGRRPYLVKWMTDICWYASTFEKEYVILNHDYKDKHEK